MSYLKCFVKEDDGIETIEFIGLVAVAAILIGVIVTIGTRMKSTADQASGALDTSMSQVEGMMGGGK